MINALLVEDNPSDALLINFLFQQICPNVKIFVISNGQEAIDFFRKEGAYSSAHTPRFLLLDLNLPIKDGFEVLREIRLNHEMDALPIFILSSSNREADFAKCNEFKVQKCFTKPFGLTEYQELVQRIVSSELEPLGISINTKD